MRAVSCADIRAAFGDKRHELNVSTHQMVILLLFNSADRLSYADILHATAIPPADLKRSLQSLACVKARALPSDQLASPKTLPTVQLGFALSSPSPASRRALAVAELNSPKPSHGAL